MLSLQSNVFAELKDQDVCDLSFLTDEQSVLLSTKIAEFESNPKSKNGGSYLKKELQYCENALESFMAHLNNIKDTLNPKQRERRSFEDIEKEVSDKAIKGLCETYTKMLQEKGDKFIRITAESILGESHVDYTNDELPLAIATKLIKG